jgi:hypothetical protein
LKTKELNLINIGFTKTTNELWVPAEEMDNFNESIINKIQIVKVFFGEQFLLPANKVLGRELLKFK